MMRLYSLLCILALTFLSQVAVAADCSAVFPDGLQNSKNGGSITFGWQSQLLSNQSGGVLDSNKTINGVPGAGNTCDPLDCSNSGSIAETGSFNSFPGNTSINIGYQQTEAHPPGDYNNLTMSSEAVLNLSPGEYTFKGNINIGNKSAINVSSAGTVRIYFKKAVSFSSEVMVNSAAGDRYIFLYGKENITLVSDSVINAVVYSAKDVTLQNNASVIGAITSEKNITLGSVSTATYDASRIDGTDFDTFCTSTPQTQLVAHWQFEDVSWNGSVGEVVDSGPNGLDGRANIRNSQYPTVENSDSAIATNPGTCSYGKFDGTDDGRLRIEDDPLLDLADGLSVTVWIKPASFPSGSSLQTIASKDENWEFHTNNSKEINWWWGGGAKELSTSGAGLVAGTWSHVAITYKSGEQKIYIDGVVRASQTTTGALTVNSDPVLIGVDLGFPGRSFNGLIDEVRIYDGALSQTEVDVIRAETHPCPIVALDHYAISYDNTPSYSDSTGLTCEASSVWIYARDAADNSVAPGVGTTLTLSSSTGQGYWSNPSVGSIADGGGGNAVYTFAGNDYVELKFNHTSPALNPNAVNVDINAGTSDPKEDAAQDPDLQVFDTGFRFIDGSDNPLPNQVAGLTSNIVYLQAVRKDNDTGSCAALFAPGTTKPVGIGAQCNNPSSCAGEQVSVANNGSAQDVATNNNGVFGYTNFPSLLFGANSQAALTLNYPDVGAISLHAQHNILNDDGTDSLVDLLGSSNTFVVKPYTLAVSDVPGNPSTTFTGSGFVAAGADFTVEVEARNANGDRTPNFGNESTAEGVILTLPVGALIYPAGGNSGSLNNESGFTAVTPAGTFQKTTVQWTEVGTMQVQPHIADGDYLGAGALNSGDGSVYTTSGNIGRFYPDHFRLVSSALDNACTAGNFSYMSQPLDLTYTLQAESALANAVVTNYDIGDGWLNAATITYQAEDSDDGVERNISNRVVIATTDWTGGVIDVVDPIAEFSRQAGLNPEDGPFMDLDIGLQLTDSLDSRVLQDLDMLSSAAGDCTTPTNTCTAKQLGSPLRAYFGRMHLKDAFGPETADIPMFWQNEYYNGSIFILNSADSCTELPVASITFADTSAADDALNSIAVTKGGITSNFQFFDIVDNAGSDEIIFSNGFAGSVYGAPSPASTVSYVLGVDFGGLEYLSGDWDENGLYGNEDHPNITVNFLHYRGNDRVIYWRELLQ